MMCLRATSTLRACSSKAAKRCSFLNPGLGVRLAGATGYSMCVCVCACACVYEKNLGEEVELMEGLAGVAGSVDARAISLRPHHHIPHVPRARFCTSNPKLLSEEAIRTRRVREEGHGQRQGGRG